MTFAGVNYLATVVAAIVAWLAGDWRLLLIDGGHWLLVLALIGATIGAFGVYSF